MKPIIETNILPMHIRAATVADIPALSSIRMSVRENVLVNTALVTEDHYLQYLTLRGRGWICELHSQAAGFAIADLEDDNIWALFVRPEHEGKGIGRQLHDVMLTWYFGQGKEKVWLSTAPGTRAERFYRKAGWQETGLKNGELYFELRAANWPLTDH